MFIYLVNSAILGTFEALRHTLYYLNKVILLKSITSKVEKTKFFEKDLTVSVPIFFFQTANL